MRSWGTWIELLRAVRAIVSAGVFAVVLGCVAARALAQERVAAGSVSGVVQDVGGTAVEASQVTLTSSTGKPQTTATADDGSFRFDDVAPGAFTLNVAADGLASASVTGSLAAGEQQQVPPIVLRVSAVNTSVDAISQEDLANQQIKQEETQRLLGVLPNFYVSYDPNAVPLTTKQKYKLALRTIVDPVTLGVTALGSGVEQAENTFAGYGQGFTGYAKRYGAGYANVAIGTVLGGAVLPEVFHQDPRYFYKGTGSIFSRTTYALSRAVIAKGDNGKWQPAYAGVLGDFGAGAISNIYYPASDRDGVALTLENGALAVIEDGIGNVVQEFLFKRLTPKTLKTPPNPPPNP